MNAPKRDFSKLMDDADAFRQQVRMAAVQVSGLKPEELAQALAYEVEPFSGIPAAEAEVVYRPIVDADPTVRVYDVAVKRRRRRGASAGGLDRWLRPVFAVACLVCGLIAVDAVILCCNKAALEKAVAERRPLQAQLDSLRRETRNAQAEAQAVRARREAAIRAQDEAAALRAAPADLLDELAGVCGGRAVVTAVSTGENFQSLTVRAIAGSAESAAAVMRGLTARAAAKGWRIVPGEIASSGTGATMSFAFEAAYER